MENTYKEYAEWLGEDVELETRQKYEKANKKLQQLAPFENELVRHLLCYLPSPVLVTFHDADTDTDILTDFHVRIVHEPDTHDFSDTHDSRGSSRGCQSGMRACTYVRVYCTRLANVLTFTKLHDRRITNVGIGVRVGPMEFQLISRCIDRVISGIADFVCLYGV